MREYYEALFQREAPQNGAENIMYLRPEQLKLPKGAQKARQNHNASIRLAASIKQYGLLEPLSVRFCSEEQGSAVYELVDGKRRLRAALIAGISKIPCKILPKDNKIYALAGIFESLQSKKLHMFEQAAAFRLLMEDFSQTQEQIAERLGVSQSTVANKMRLLQLSREEQQDILEGGLTERHARAILRLKTPELRQIAIHRMRAEHQNVAKAEALVEEMLCVEPTKSTQKAGADKPKSVFFEEDALPKPPKQAIFAIEHPKACIGGTTPKKFVLPDLTPLYNSIDRTLAIFRKTGADATCSREESENGVRIIIEIPQNA